MTDAAPDRLQQFRRELEPGGGDYLHVAPPQPGCAHIRFTGPFKGRTTLRDARVMTLAHYRKLAGATAPALRQFIEAGPEQEQPRRLVIGLNVAQIDTPVLLKTIIMVRKYKRLHRGRHEYVTPVALQQDSRTTPDIIPATDNTSREITHALLPLYHHAQRDDYIQVA